MLDQTEIHPLTAADFPDFFAALNNGNQPFSWQQELVDHVLATSQWPDRLVVPTGGGKSSVVDIHVFLNCCRTQDTAQLPRRLHVVVNRRALVDSQADRAIRIQEILRTATQNDSPLLWRAAALLSSLRSSTQDDLPFLVGHLRGELENRSLPVDDLSACAVIAATPEMWGSRLLFRGYGSSRYARPRETAVVALDSVLVLDEAHLNRQLLATARRVRQLQQNTGTEVFGALQVTETTATAVSPAAEGQQTIGVAPSKLQDSGSDRFLLQRLHANKQLTLRPVEGWRGKPAVKDVVNTAVSETHRLLETAGGTIGCIVNHVDTAVKIAAELRKLKFSVKVLVGRMRPADVSELRASHPGLFTTAGDPSVDVVVATQTIEVGVDMNFRGLVTELASGTALAQRMGRLNRIGEFDHTEAVVITPVDESLIKEQHPPYLGKDLTSGLRWLHGLEEGGSINPAAIDQNIAPSESPRRDLYQRLEWADLEVLARTSDDLFADPDLALWLRDDLEPEQAMGGMVVRDPLPADDVAALELLRALPPAAPEVFPANLKLLAGLVEELVVDERTRFKLELKEEGMPAGFPRRAFLYRNRELSIMTPADRIRPGDVLVIDRGIRFTSESVATEKPTEEAPHPVPLKTVVSDGNLRLHVFDQGSKLAEQSIFKTLAELDPEEILEWWQELGNTSQLVVSSTRVQSEGRTVIAWFYETSRPETSNDEEARQEWTDSEAQVLLDNHQNDVAERARTMSLTLGLEAGITEQLVTAALHHDDGKADPRFQRILGASKASPLAKSGTRSLRQAWIAKARSGLPTGWRHEQLSALLVHYAMNNGEVPVSELVIRITGTSHGRGRSGFPHVDTELLDAALSDSQSKVQEELRGLAHDLFSVGNWDALITRTNREWGHWTVAGLEAIERAADAQISQEGR